MIFKYQEVLAKQKEKEEIEIHVTELEQKKRNWSRDRRICKNFWKQQESGYRSRSPMTLTRECKNP